LGCLFSSAAHGNNKASQISSLLALKHPTPSYFPALRGMPLIDVGESANAPHALHGELLHPTTPSAIPDASVGASVGAPQITTLLGELLSFSHFNSLPFHVTINIYVLYYM